MIDIGDLVTMRVHPRPPAQPDLGVVIRKHVSCSVLNSEHMSHIKALYPFVYYVFFNDRGIIGPLNGSELDLKQHRHAGSKTSSMSG